MAQGLQAAPAATVPAPAAAQQVASLRQLIQRLEGARRGGGEAGDVSSGDVLSTGCAALDRLLPRGGLERGTLVEWRDRISQGSISQRSMSQRSMSGGAGLLAFAAVRQAQRRGGLVVVLDRARRFYPPTLASWGLDWRRVVVVQTRERAEEIWAAEQALRCPAVAAVYGPLDRLDDREQRRLQLAAEAGRAWGLWRRPPLGAGPVVVEPTWADVQWEVYPWTPPLASLQQTSLQQSSLRQASLQARRRWRVTLVRCRGGPAGRSVWVEWNERTGEWREAELRCEASRLSVVAPLAAPAVARRA
ncbi:MAG: hypothetical protein U0939_18340 [Pirellulales bacterium]